MIYKSFRGGEERISLLGLGCMRLPKKGPESEEINFDEAVKIVDEAYASGVNYFDTAYPYHGGTSEAFTGKALSRYPRDSYYLATKLPIWMLEKEADIDRIFEEQLQRCGVEYFDFYLCHALSATGFATLQRLDVLSYLEKYRREGRIRHIGFSFHDTPEVLETICDAFDWEFAQLQINALDWNLYRSEEQYQILAKRNIPCIVMEPIRGGRLADLGEEANSLLREALPGKSVASWSLRFAAGLPNVMTVLSGMSTLAQVRDNINTLDDFTPLTPGQNDILHEAVEIYRKNTTIACTACRYCMPCPAGVDIPGIFALYNDCILHLGLADFRKKYALLPPAEHGSQCVQCGQCESVCPQHLAIPLLLQGVESGKV